jgi:hypothetical protein
MFQTGRRANSGRRNPQRLAAVELLEQRSLLSAAQGTVLRGADVAEYVPGELLV